LNYNIKDFIVSILIAYANTSFFEQYRNICAINSALVHIKGFKCNRNKRNAISGRISFAFSERCVSQV